MDIKKVMNVGSSISPNRRENEKPAELDFQELLRQANPSQKNTPQSPSFLPSLGEVESASNMALVMSKVEEINQARSKGIEAAEGTLSLLEQYQKAMANPGMSLKKVDPLVESLSKEIKGLDLLSERLPPSDPLQKILTEVGIVSTVEIEKFRRGDYI